MEEEKFNEPFNLDETDENVGTSEENSTVVDETAPGSETSDIDKLLKQYEEIPREKSKENDTKASLPEKAKKVSSKIPKKFLPFIIVGGVLIIAVVILFIVKPKKKTVVKKQPVTKTNIAKNSPGKNLSSSKKASPLIYPGAKVLAEKKEEGISLNVFETTTPISKIKIFYQKKLSDMGYEIVSVNKGKNFFNMCYAKNEKFCGISIIPVSEKKFIIISKD